ncbi:MAG: ECF-type sigma factor [Dokdonella sp.]|nr:sigma-70 family RNA polymerase sigma factor [Dokdonella sp.]MCB1569474.1 sigma-70 family RNA polymerase sigma factor [Xanthomonadales bacterium]MCB1573647.1 sigma-70 family RNA polymerase sigma factor [Xanthomonadales bacterium]MCB1577463.1 sigma-70 family RNA polymerase sigma factor [Xanthomonadales bacterium]
MRSDQAGITDLLAEWREGDRRAENELAEHLYPVLRGLVGVQLRRAPSGLTLSATELVNEAYIRLEQQREVEWRNRGHFFAIAATVVRRVVIDYLRERSAEKRGAGAIGLRWEDVPSGEQPAVGDQIDWLALDQALTRLQELDAESARVVELRLFGGLSNESIAEVMSSSVATVGRQWRFARTWLAEQMDLSLDGS